jgi:excisionase family DNA binding protein
MESKREWLTTEAAADYLQVHVETMRRWAREGAIPSVKLGNRGGFRFKLVDLDAFLESRRAERRDG